MGSCPHMVVAKNRKCYTHTMKQHTCIVKDCGVKYQDHDEDDYYCPTHLEERKILIAKIDANRKPIEEVPSDLKVFDSVARTKTGTQVSDGVVVTRIQSFARASDIL